MIDPSIQTYYRIVHTDPPSISDFLSYAARGVAVPTDPELRRLWHGVSVYDTLDRAMSRARKQPGLGMFIAELQIRWGRGIRVERTGHRRGHHTIWGDAAALLDCVTRVATVV
jgi:hypothetical protein